MLSATPSSPISLPALLAGRYLGALVLASLLALATGLGFLLVPLPLGVPRRPSLLAAAWSEAAWHVRLSLRGWGTPLALVMLTALGVGGAFVHVVLHADGPVLPRPDFVDPLMVDFFYLIIAFVVAAFVGVMARRDDRPGYGELADATPAPLGSRVAGRALAAAAVTILFAVTPGVSVWIVTALVVPDAFSLLDPPLYFGLVLAPSMLELCALVLLAHAVVRHTGAAHAAGIICAFFIVVNHELAVTSYPPVEVGVPPSITLSEFSGWAPWLGYVLTLDLYKLAVAAGIVALAWLAWPRGTALTVPLRWRAGMRRAAGAAGALAAAAVVLAAGLHGVLHEQLVTLGGYESQPAATADDAAWERRWWPAAAPFSVAGGEADIEIDPADRRALARWRLDGVRSRSRTLHGSLPHGAEIAGATVDGREAPVTVALDHFALPLDACGPAATVAESGAPDPRVQAPPPPGREDAGSEAEGCTVELEVAARGEGWSAEGETPWLHPTGVWLRAADLLPALGHDPDRLVRAPSERRAHGLVPVPVPGDVAAGALAPAAGVAPAGDWRWSVTIAAASPDADRAGGTAVAATGRTDGPLDFALAWWPGAPVETRRGGVAALHGRQRTRDAGGVLDDVAAMRACVAATLGRGPAVRTVLQAPRERGETALYGDLLWLPEHEGWDIAGESFGRWRRRATIAAALAARALADGADLRKEPGGDWLRVGVAGWVHVRSGRADRRRRQRQPGHGRLHQSPAARPQRPRTQDSRGGREAGEPPRARLQRPAARHPRSRQQPLPAHPAHLADDVRRPCAAHARPQRAGGVPGADGGLAGLRRAVRHLHHTGPGAGVLPDPGRRAADAAAPVRFGSACRAAGDLLSYRDQSVQTVEERFVVTYPGEERRHGLGRQLHACRQIAQITLFLCAHLISQGQRHRIAVDHPE